MPPRAAESFARLLCNLRWLAVAGQLLAIAVVSGAMAIAVPLVPLLGGVLTLVVFNLWSIRESRRIDGSATAIAIQLLFDIVALTWQIAWSGGIENPFSSLFLLPMALAVVALPARWTGIVAAVSVAGYGASALLGREIPHLHHFGGDGFALHKFGMGVNFVVSALVLLSFFARLAAASRAKDREMAQLREQFTRNEGIVALATHAASVAHELNTPLATLTLMVEDLEQGGGSPEQLEDYATLRKLLEVCSERVMELAAPAARGDDAVEARVNLEDVIQRWQLVRPTIDLRRTGDIGGHELVEPAIGYLLQVLLNNAADSGEKAGQPRVDLLLRIVGGALEGEIRDYGSGLDEAKPLLPATLFRTDKPRGLGIGLALSHATVERLGGRLSMDAPEQGSGVRVVFHLPGMAK
ncbi:MAG: ATP-binding protein [Steroidobacteraceae bacterium]